MSEYQYYEFLAIDRPLTDRQRAELRDISSRAEITASSFVNEYNWGDLRANPATLMERYFDAHLYMASWGTRTLMFRLPKDALDAETAKLYCYTDAAAVTETSGHLIISLRSDQDSDEDWFEARGELGAVVQARSDLAAGDRRLLYLSWLLAIQSDEVDDEDEEPPVPDGLGALNGALAAAADFLRIDEDLLAVAATTSQDIHNDEGLSDWIAELPQRQKDALLTRVAEGDGAQVQAGLRRRFRETRGRTAATAEPRTALDLWTAADVRRAEREAAEAEQLRQQREREIAAKAERYARHLDELSVRQEAAWERAATLIETKLPRDYDQAVTLLTDLRALAERDGTPGVFTKRILALREQHKRKPALMLRFDKARFPRELGTAVQPRPTSTTRTCPRRPIGECTSHHDPHTSSAEPMPRPPGIA